MQYKAVVITFLANSLLQVEYATSYPHIHTPILQLTQHGENGINLVLLQYGDMSIPRVGWVIVPRVGIGYCLIMRAKGRQLFTKVQVMGLVMENSQFRSYRAC